MPTLSCQYKKIIWIIGWKKFSVRMLPSSCFRPYDFIPTLPSPRSHPHAPVKICCLETDYKSNNHYPHPCFNVNVKKNHFNQTMKKFFWKKRTQKKLLSLPCSRPHPPVHRLRPQQKYVVQKQTTKQIITCHANASCQCEKKSYEPYNVKRFSVPNQNMLSKNRQRNK